MDAYPLIQFSWLGQTWYGFALALFVDGLAAFALLAFSAKRHGLKPGSASQLMLLSVVLGLIVSRLVFSIFSWQHVFLDPMEGTFLGLLPFFKITHGGLSFYGMLLGVLLACALFARLTHQPVGMVMDAAAVPLGTFSVFALAAQILGGAGFGEEVAPWLQWFPMAVVNTFEEWNTAVFVYQAAAVLLITLWLARRQHVKLSTGNHQSFGEDMLRLLIPLNALQLFFEALRQDDYPRLAANAFIRVNQLLPLAFLIGITVLLTKKAPRRAAGIWLPLLFSIAAAIAAEFNEKLPLPRELLYAVSLLAQVLLSVMWLWELRYAEGATIPNSSGNKS